MTDAASVLVTLDPAAPAVGGGMAITEFLVPLLIFGSVWYFLVLRPQQQERDQREQMLAALAKGDGVITTGGLYGTIVEMEQDVLTVELAEKLRVRMERSAVARKQGDPAGKK